MDEASNEIFDFSKDKNQTARENRIRDWFAEQFLIWLSEKFGSDNVGRVGKNEVAVAVGNITNSNGKVVEIPVVCKAEIKTYNETLRKDGKITPIYDIWEHVNYYEENKKKLID